MNRILVCLVNQVNQKTMKIFERSCCMVFQNQVKINHELCSWKFKGGCRRSPHPEFQKNNQHIYANYLRVATENGIKLLVTKK